MYAAKNEVLVHLREGVTERQFESLASHISSLGGDGKRIHSRRIHGPSPRTGWHERVGNC